MTTEQTAELKAWRAVNRALHDEMTRDESVVLFGEDSGAPGGVFGLSRGLQKKFGPWRVKDTPIAENSIVGMAVGAAAVGLRPIAEIMYADFVTLAMDQVVNQAAKFEYFSGGRPLPLVLLLTVGAGGPHGAQHSQSLEGWFCSVPGLRVVMPATAADAAGLMRAAIRCDGPVLYFLPSTLLTEVGPVPAEPAPVPIGEGRRARVGGDLTLVSYGRMIRWACDAADELAAEGVSVEVIDLRTLKPLDTPLILESLSRTNRLMILHEALSPHGVGAEIAATVAEQGFDLLDAPIVRVTPPFVNVPASVDLSDLRLPTVDLLVDRIRALVSGEL